MMRFNEYFEVARDIGWLMSFPLVCGTYYQSWKTRQESRRARQGLVVSVNCLEFVLGNGELVNVVPLETLHSLPEPGDVVLLPGVGLPTEVGARYGAYRVTRVEHIYQKVETPRARMGQARLAMAVAHLEPVSEAA